jgi:DNA polymerase III subunit gamma/tau
MDLVNKYRPTALGQIIGQDAVVATLRGALRRDEDLNPTTLFCGPHSTGKTTLAWILALYHNCTNRTPDGEACRECASCQSILSAIREGRAKSTAVMEKPVAERGIDAIRALEDMARYRCEHRYRFIILDEVHNLTPQAQDAALRLFERPPAQTRFILCTTEPRRMKPTFFSRFVVYQLAPISIEDTAKRLLWGINKRENFGLDQQTILGISRAVDGSPREALNMLSQVSAAVQGGMEPTQLPALIGASEQAKPYIIVKKYCSALFQGQGGNSLNLVAQHEAHDYLVQQILLTLDLVLRQTVSPQLLDASKGWVLDGVTLPATPDTGAASMKRVDDLGNLIDIFLDAQHLIKRREADPAVVMDRATVAAWKITQSWNA